LLNAAVRDCDCFHASESPALLRLDGVLLAQPVVAEDLRLLLGRQLDTHGLCLHHFLDCCDHPVQTVDPLVE